MSFAKPVYLSNKNPLDGEDGQKMDLTVSFAVINLNLNETWLKIISCGFSFAFDMIFTGNRQKSRKNLTKADGNSKCLETRLFENFE
jgi:hypothetical protein